MTYPLNLIFTDTETTTLRDDEEEHEPKLKLGVAEYVRLDTNLDVIGIETLDYYDINTFWLWAIDILREVKDLVIYAHNWSFDFPVLNGFIKLEEAGLKLIAIIDASPPIILRYQAEGLKLEIIDSMNYFQQKLEDMGRAVGIPKLDIDLLNADNDELLKYCKQDVLILRESVISLMRYLKSNQLTRMTHTISSLAFSTYVNRFKPCEIYIDGNEERTDIARRSYFGGRTECFRLGKYEGKFYLIDVNSQYPFVMRNNFYPVRTFAHHKRVSIKDLESVVYKHCLTAKCTVNTHIPVFPYKIEGRTCFPTGRFQSYLSTPELIYGLDNGLIESVEELVLHYRHKIFERYVDYMYNQRNRYREQGNTCYAELSKKLMNTLYGKFGQKLDKWEISNIPARGYPGKWYYYDMDRFKRVQYMEINGVVYEAVHETESRDSYPAIAAHVTAHGRILIQLMIDYLGRDHIYYCDTDSLLIDDHAYQRVKDRLNNRVLGCWSLDGEYQSIDIRGPKDYTFGDKEKIKGVKKDYTITKDGLYRMIQFSNMRGLIRKGRLGSPSIKWTEKDLKRVYHKGIVRSDGIVVPFVLGSFPS